MIDRVTYYSKSDGSIALYRQRFEEVIGAYRDDDDYTIEDILELYQCKLFIDNGVFEHSVSAEEWRELLGKSGQIASAVAKYFKRTDNGTLLAGFTYLDLRYKQSFWDVLESYGGASRFSVEDLRQVLNSEPAAIRCILRCKKIVKNYSELLADYIVNNPDCAELILAEYVEVHDDPEWRGYYFPSCLDVGSVLAAYVEMDSPNYNYLRMIVNSRESDMHVSPQVKIAAKQKMKSILEDCGACMKTMMVSYGVEFSEDIDDVWDVYVDEKGRRIWRYNKSFLLSADNIRLFDMIGPVFGFLNRDRIIDLVNKKSDSDIFEEFQVRAVGEYSPNDVFIYKSYVALAQLQGLQCILEKVNRSLEMVVESYCNEYLDKIYGLNLRELKLSRSESFAERVISLFPKMDGLVKQYNLFVEHRQVTDDMMHFYHAVPLTECKSLLEKKYCEAIEDNLEYSRIVCLVFSEQSTLSYSCNKRGYRSFYDLLLHENEIRIDQFSSAKRMRIEYLREQGVINVVDGAISLADGDCMEVLYDLYRNRECSYWRKNSVQRAYLDQLRNKGWIRYDDHLLCRSEREYFSYYMDNRMFSDGEMLRNEYLHGISDKNSEIIYYKALHLLILLLLKISDDCRQYSTLVKMTQLTNFV